MLKKQSRYRIRRLPRPVPEYDSTRAPYGLWDTEENQYVTRWGDPDPENLYWCSHRDVAVMRRRDLNHWWDQAVYDVTELPNA
jgi:hypothetical protein